MKALPESVSPYKKTPTFTETTIPSGLLKAHQTKEGVWGKIVITSGQLLYRILEPELEEIHLSTDLPGIIEPTVLHEVAPMGQVSFYVEFNRKRA